MAESTAAAELLKLGAKRKDLIKKLAKLDEELTPVILAAHREGVAQVAIVEATGYVRESVRLKCLSPEEKARVNEARRLKSRGSAPTLTHQ